ncbi:hypothetical protein K3G39_20220 [Pontibacter sp. HSC-14F20]|uniref:hypothetical protein n=1 Tax=Pontibacter sp. HSC-14F20 TaxID=2864136 RepID=UPI001C73D318|nr:hypothetical protein [Pontibacter sp. HSC-14F20]MBX0335564.1 hypothetical protein [Pontibacter sp. HSC-14F20]
MKINKTSLANYIKNLLNECNSYLPDSELITDEFIRLNTYLLSKSGKQNTLFTLQARKELPGLLRSVLYYAKSKYKLQPVNKALPQVGNLVYHDKKAFKVVTLENDVALIADRADPKNKLTQPVQSLRKIENTVIVRRRRRIDFADEAIAILADNALAYYEWLASLQKQFVNVQPLEQGQATDEGRILVITSNEKEIAEILKELHAVPFQHYKNNAFVPSASCASFKPVADVFTSYDLSDATRVRNNKYKEIVVIGDRHCNKHLRDLIKLCHRGIIERFILIASDTPESDFTFTEWHWTKEEANLLNRKDLHGEIRFKLTAPFQYNGKDNGVTLLQEHVNLIKNILTEASENHNRIRLDKVYFFVNEYLRYTLPPGNENAVAANFLERLQSDTVTYLDSEDFKDLFYERAVYSQQIIQNISTQLKDAFFKLNAFFYEYSPKYAQVSSSLKNFDDYEEFTGGRYIVAHNSILNDVRNVPELHNIDYMVGAAPLFSRKELKGFDYFIDSELNLNSTQFIFPFILNRSQYETMLEANGDIKLYLYEDIEDFKFQKIREAYENKFCKKIEHNGRSSFTSLTYEFINVPLSETETNEYSSDENEVLLPGLSRKFYNLKEHDQSFYESLFNVDDVEYDKEKRDYVPQDETEYSITFTDFENLNLLGYRRVILVEQEDNKENLVQVPVNQVNAGDTIIVYRNQQKELLYDILLEQDNSGVIKEIERASNLWVSTLKEIIRRNDDDILAAEKQLRAQNIFLNFQTLLSYTNKDRKFPQDARTLEAIRQLALDHNLSGNYFTTSEQLQNALKRKAQFHSLTITLGRGVSDEVTHYYFTGNKGKILESLDPEIVEVLKQNIKRGTVKAIDKRN